MSLRLNTNSVRTVLDNLQKASNAKLNAAWKALIEGGLKVKGSAVRITPLELGNLRGSAYVVWDKGGAIATQFTGDEAPKLLSDQSKVLNLKRRKVAGAKRKAKLLVIVGFTAYYAIYVHENLDADHTVGRAKYLAISLRMNAAAIKKLVMSAMKSAK